MWFKECPRCTDGDVFTDQDGFRHCVTCGYIQYPSMSAALRAELVDTVVIEFTQRDALSTAFHRTPPF